MNNYNKLIAKLKKYPRRTIAASALVAVFAVSGMIMILTSQAATFSAVLEAEDGQTGGNATPIDGGGASGRAIKFAGTTTPPVTPPTGGGGGASRTDPYCGGSFSGPIGGSTQPIPATTGKTLTVGSGKQHTSVSSALSAAAAGDNIVVDPGTYGALDVNKSGSAGKCITIVGNGGKAIFSGVNTGGSKYVRLMNMTSKGSGSYGVNANNSQNIVFSNFEVDGSADGGIQIAGGKFVLIDGCNVHDTNGGVGNSGEGEAISIADKTTDAEVRYCTVHDNGEEGIDVKYSYNTNSKVHHNIVWNCNGPNIYLDGANGVEVYNNISYGSRGTSKAGIGVASETTYGDVPQTSALKIYNNVLYGNANAGLQFYTESGGKIFDISIYNNTVTGNRIALQVNTSSMSGTNPVFNNIFVGEVNSGSFQMGKNFTTDPGFVGGTDYRLKAGSAAIDTAQASGAPAFDMSDITRPKGAGVGAYEQ